MRIHDISQEVFSCRAFPGDPVPQRQVLSSMEEGALYNLTALSMCAHNGTHIDAPFHFIREGKPVEQVALDVFVGECFLARHQGEVTADDAEEILIKAAGTDRILISGSATVTAPAARVFAARKIKLLGNESQTVGPEDGPMEVHCILLGSEVALLEGIVLDGIPEGHYFLSAAPLNLAGADGAPCRAYLIEKEDVL